MTRKEIMSELKKMNVNFKVTEKTEELEKKLENAKKEREDKEMKKAEEKSNFTELKKVLEKIDECYIINETERRLTTNKIMFCKRANNRYRAYLKLKTSDKLATEKNTQYKANVLIDLNDSYAEYTLKRLYR